ncbi:MAG: AAA family ATPase [Methanomassiliicoccaceae archaeon]|nr:AAA family ATPase [Methanomassiliicoccaceae archaeon]
MKRKIEEELIEWKKSPNRKCLLIFGARQVGKTYSVTRFSKNYKHFLHVNFETTPQARELFEGDISTDFLIEKLRMTYPKVRIVPEDTLIFFDEVQLCPRAFTSLKPFTDDGRYHVIASGSSLGTKYKRDTSYPVGYVDIMTMYSLDFEEYLWATGMEGTHIEYVTKCIKETEPIDDFILKTFDDRFREYLVVGGMPEVVEGFSKDRSFYEARMKQERINRMYLEDIGKYAEKEDKSKAAECFRSIPNQLAKDNKKFIYAQVDGTSNANGKTYGSPVRWLVDSYLVNQCFNLRDPQIPFEWNADYSSFKLFFHDTGLLMGMMAPQAAWSILNADTYANKGGVAENAVCEALVKTGIAPFYFATKKLETDFIIPMDRDTAVIEVKSGNNKRAKAIYSVMSPTYGVKRGMIFENTNIHVDDSGVEHYPLFAISFIHSLERYGWKDIDEERKTN